MIDRAVERASAHSPLAALSAIATVDALAERAGWGHAPQALDAIGHVADLGDARTEASLAARSMASDEGTEAGALADRRLGVVTDLAVLGPFRDTGGGLTAKDGPEAPGSSFSDMRARYSWGTVDVGWRDVPRAFAGATGVPLDLFVHPRAESCTWIATKLTLASAQPVIVRLAASGQARLMFDDVELGRAEDVNASARFDRLASRVTTGPGAHLVAAKICSGALSDDGLARLTLTTESGASLADATSADLGNIHLPKRGAREPRSKTSPTTAKSIVTPLEAALAASKGGSAAADLDGAILRTLGGADDLRSPRAPGLLDALVRRPDATDDMVAMAGWIAPSGANRSGWLNLSRSRAEAAHDARTVGFAQRRLIAEHLNASMPDWAMASLRAAAPAGDAEAVLLTALVEEGLGTDALRAQAMRELATAFHAAPARVPAHLVSELASVAAGFDPALSRDAREELARRGDRGAAWVQAESSRGAKALSEAARVAFETAGIDDANEALTIARATSQAGAHDLARQLYAKLVDWAPNRPEAWAGLADEIAATPDAQSESALRAALRRARELAPGEARYREELALRSLGSPASHAPAAEATPRGDEHYLVPSQTILARRQGVPSGLPDCADRQLHFLRAVVMHPDRRVSMLIHYAREIVVAPRTEGELYEDMPVEADLVEILRARVHRKDGGTAFPTEEHNEGSRPRIRWPDLEPGDVVEVAFREWTARPVGGRGDSPFYFIDVAGAFASHPTLYNEVDVETLPDRQLYLDVLNGGDYQRTEKDEDGRHITRLVWEHPAVLNDEPLAPAQTEIVPTVVGSTFKTWTDFRAWYSEAVRGFTEPDEEVRRLAAELTKGKRTREEKLQALFDFVADDIRYVNYTSGEWWLPNRPQQLLARREGDCDDKAMLLITLLKSVGIEAQEVMVQTRLTAQPSIVLAKNAAVPLFDHGIAFLPGPDGGTYLDATSPQSRLGPLPSMDAKAVALRMDGPAEIIHLPPSSPDDHGSKVDWTITLKPDGSGDLVGEERHVGDGAFWLRSNLSQADSRLNYVEANLLGPWFPTVVVDKAIDFKGDLPHGAAWVRYKARSEGLARHEQGEMVVPISQSMPLASQIAPLVTRTLPVQLPPYFAPSHETRTIRIVAPAGWSWGELPLGGDENGKDFGRAHLEIARDPRDARTVIVSRSMSFDMDLIPVEKYAAWRTWVQRVDALMHKGIRLEKEQAEMRLRHASLLVLGALVVGCGANRGPTEPRSERRDLPGMVAGAMREEANGDPARAAELWLGALDAAVASPDNPWQLATEEAALDALVARSVASFADASEDSALVYRMQDGSFDPAPPSGSIAGRLGQAAAQASDPFSPGLIARALHELVTHRGAAPDAQRWRAATGCAEEATVIGPLGWTAVTGVHDDDPLAKGDASIRATYAGSGAFGRPIAPVLVQGRGCALDPALASVEKGVRDVVVDVAAPRGTMGIALRTHGAALLRAGGLVVLERPYALGGDETVRFARVEVPRAGTVRVVARVGMDDDGEPVEIDAFGADGKPLPIHAPRTGETASVAVASAREIAWPSATTDAERTTLAVAALAAGERPTAEDAASTGASRSDAPPELLLAYARAVEEAGDLDEVHRAERARSAYERVLEAWPGAWEALAAHAVLAGVRRGQTEQRIWTLRDLEEQRAKAHVVASGPVLDLFEASVAGHDRLFDRAKAALDHATTALPAAVSLTRDASRAVTSRTGAERVAFECDDGKDVNRGRLDCYEAIRATGDRARAEKELDRVRTLYAAPQAYLALTLRDALADGDAATARKAFEAMLPGERSLSAAYAAESGPGVLGLLASLAPSVRDAPVALPALFRASGDDPTVPFAGIAEKVAAADRASPVLPSAATAVLAHDERYEISPVGLVHFVLFDVRRVSGTTDVEENAQADPPEVAGRTSMRILRRRMFKKDGRVIEPDRAPNAAQAHAELSQLEQGDIVEAIYEGWTLPGSEGNVVLDTPDLLPERTAVHDASIEIRLPAELKVSLWAHPTLGSPSESRDGATRVVRWKMKDAGERRIEEGTPKMDRDVAVSLSTATWADSARALRETLASLDERSPEVRAWARNAAGGKTKPREIVDAVVTAAGVSVKEGMASALADAELGRPDGAQQTTARTILSNHEGSRTWLVIRALRELGIAADAVIAENEPFSADPAFPPHEGRFNHPLAVAHVEGRDVWIDADVSGPPLPAGRISPELRGRAALHADGRVEPLPVIDGDQENAERDEVDVRLTLDDRGDARGQLTVLLQGRAAQELSEALLRIVGDERQRALRGVALAWVPFANVDEVLLSSTEESWQVALRAKITVPGYAQAESGPGGRRWVLPGIDPIHAVYPRPTVATLGSTFASQGERHDALAVNRAIQYHVHRRIELPSGATVARAPGGFEVKDSVLSARRRIAVAPGAVEDDFTLSVTTGTVAADAYAGFSKDAHSIDDGFLASTRVKPAP